MQLITLTVITLSGFRCKTNMFYKRYLNSLGNSKSVFLLFLISSLKFNLSQESFCIMVEKCLQTLSIKWKKKLTKDLKNKFRSKHCLYKFLYHLINYLKTKMQYNKIQPPPHDLPLIFPSTP